MTEQRPTRLRVKLFDAVGEALRAAGVKVDDEARTLIVDIVEHGVRELLWGLAARHALEPPPIVTVPTVTGPHLVGGEFGHTIEEWSIAPPDKLIDTMAKAKNSDLARAAFDAAVLARPNGRVLLRDGIRIMFEARLGKVLK